MRGLASSATWMTLGLDDLSSSTRALAVLATVAFAAGALVAVALPGSPTATEGQGACAEDQARHPAEGCVPPTEVCHAWLRGAADRTVSCQVPSEDGATVLTVDLQGVGEAGVEVLDGDGRVVLEERWALSSSAERRIRGGPGAWTLEVSFEDAQGQGRVIMYG